MFNRQLTVNGETTTAFLMALYMDLMGNQCIITCLIVWQLHVAKTNDNYMLPKQGNYMFNGLLLH